MNFSGDGVEAGQVTMLTVATIDSFLAGVRGGRCNLPTARPGMTLEAK
jgi:hypothetical protein